MRLLDKIESWSLWESDNRYEVRHYHEILKAWVVDKFFYDLDMADKYFKDQILSEL